MKSKNTHSKKYSTLPLSFVNLNSLTPSERNSHEMVAKNVLKTITTINFIIVMLICQRYKFN